MAYFAAIKLIDFSGNEIELTDVEGLLERILDELYLTRIGLEGAEAQVRIVSAKGLEVNPAAREQLEALEVAKLVGESETADTDMLSKDIVPSYVPCMFRVMVMLETSGIFSAILKAAGSIKTLKLNSATALTANCAYIFDIIVHEGDTVNFQTDTSSVVTLRVQEIAGAIQ